MPGLAKCLDPMNSRVRSYLKGLDPSCCPKVQAAQPDRILSKAPSSSCRCVNDASVQNNNEIQAHFPLSTVLQDFWQPRTLGVCLLKRKSYSQAALLLRTVAFWKSNKDFKGSQKDTLPQTTYTTSNSYLLHPSICIHMH